MEVYLIVGGFILFDVVTGVMKALHGDGLNSSVAREGLFHKLSELLAVIGANLLEYASEYIEIGVDIPVLNTVAVYICIMELISILENISEVNPGLSKLLSPYLAKLKAKEDSVENEQTGN